MNLKLLDKGRNHYGRPAPIRKAKPPSIPCPGCSYPVSAVMDSRPSGTEIRRRRTCCKCGYRFTTYEGIAPHQEIDYQI